jgi:hypothetical protein
VDLLLVRERRRGREVERELRRRWDRRAIDPAPVALDERERRCIEIVDRDQLGRVALELVALARGDRKLERAVVGDDERVLRAVIERS